MTETSLAASDRVRVVMRVAGTVQGVGFRPFVYREAIALDLTGWVRNDSSGVTIDAEGPAGAVAELERRLREAPPPLARVSSVEVEPSPLRRRGSGFRILESDEDGPPSAPVSVDTAACAACLAEVDDPTDRRHRYPFTNCTDCGPRYTIVWAIPYDRPATTMAGFSMCAPCRGEYDDPTDRRFHAQPNACPSCGPQLAWCGPDGAARARGDDALVAAAGAIASGAVCAVKGLGGFHLATRAGSDEAVGELRRRKGRDDKPFAVMVADVETAGSLCVLDEAAVSALTSPRRPIVLAPRRSGAPIAEAVAPGLPELGVMLPYTPLHHLLVSDVGEPIVLTSGNVTDEPIAHTDDDAATRLGPLVDGLLTHDRPIHIRCDDSVARAHRGRLQILRRSRGYAPEPLALPVPAPHPLLAVGAELKSTVSVARGPMVVASHHLGDLEHLATHQAFEQAISHLCHLYEVTPSAVACDLHPEYLSTKLATDLDLPIEPVQHHHAHVAACLVDHGRTDRVVALAFDGLGYGDDGGLWGGELLVADLVESTRAGHLRAVPMPGGARAISEPWRMAAVWGDVAGRPDPGPDAARILALASAPATRETTSAGRLFDAVAVLLGGRRTVTYEAQAAIELESLARTTTVAAGGPGLDEVSWDGDVLDPAPLVASLIDARAAGADVAQLAAAFHHRLASAAARAAADVAGRHGLDTVVLTGGVFQNALLSESVARELGSGGLRVLEHQQTPANDGGISIGQAAVAAARADSDGPAG